MPSRLLVYLYISPALVCVETGSLKICYVCAVSLSVVYCMLRFEKYRLRCVHIVSLEVNSMYLGPQSTDFKLR